MQNSYKQPDLDEHPMHLSRSPIGSQPFRTQPGVPHRAISPAVAAGSPPNIVTTNPLLVGEHAPVNVLIPLDDLLERTQLRQAVFGPAWDAFTYEGLTYGVPGIESGPRYGQVWNQKLVDEAGLAIDGDTVMDWNEFLDVTDKLTRTPASSGRGKISSANCPRGSPIRHAYGTSRA